MTAAEPDAAEGTSLRGPSHGPVVDALTAYLQDTILVADRFGRIREVYGSYAATGGWRRADVVGKSVLRFVHPYDAAVAFARMSLHLSDPARAGKHRLELRAALAAGGWRWVEAMVANRLSVPGIRGLVITVRDIAARREAETELREAESELRESEQRFRAISDLSRDMVSILDTTGNVLYQSASVFPVLGYTVEERLGRNAFELVHPEDLPQAQLALARMLDDAGGSSGPHEVEVRLRHRDGSWRWSHVVGVNLIDHPAVRGIVVNSRDVNIRKTAQQAAVTAQARLDAALWAARVGFWSYDIIADRATMSPQFFELTGIAAADWDADAAPWESRIHPNDFESVAAAYRAVAYGAREAVEIEYRLATPGGWLWVADRGRVVERDAAGRSRVIAGTTTNISTRKQLEQAIVDAQSREQQRMSQELHDGLGQELTGISLLLKSIVTRLQRAQVAGDVTADIELAVDYITNTIRDARTLARGLHPVRADHGGIVAALGGLAAKSSVPGELAVELDATGWPGLRLADEAGDHLYRITQEALSNAVRHGGANRVRIELSADAGGVRLSVRDDGRGIPADAHAAPGLGLRTMNYRAQMIGGVLTVEPVAPHGTEVVLRAPLASVVAA